ncbi:conserved hypothetical protein [Herminiimonas arsenicoxydans]|uniref:DUF883 domain-containing protein n=1 Tax=Herminiimonas arsenicoxydans TaxID=204773 RepID=A4G4I7_HERAR|nr:conserved hypothetical protein [Herminiimonas arsenicoxydans]
MAEARIEAVSDDLKALSQDAKKMAREAQESLLQKNGELSAKCVEFFNSAVAAAKEVPAVAVAKTKEVAVSTDEYVHHNPWRAVTLSAGVGVLLGLLLAKK